MKWFKHDSDAHRDAKLKKVIIKYGMSGYGLYWYCLEEISRNVNEQRFTFELESDAEIISHDTGISAELINEMMAYMVDLKLFENQDNVITCLKMLHRLDASMTSNLQMRNIIKRAKSGHSHDPVMTPSCPDKIRLEEIRLEEKNSENKVSTRQPAAKVPFQKIVDLYNNILRSPDKKFCLPEIVKLTPTRKSHITQRWRDELNDLEKWENYFLHVAESKFLTGRVAPAPGRKRFIATIDFLINPQNLVQIAEGKYHDVQH